MQIVIYQWHDELWKWNKTQSLVLIFAGRINTVIMIMFSKVYIHKLRFFVEQTHKVNKNKKYPKNKKWWDFYIFSILHIHFFVFCIFCFLFFVSSSNGTLISLVHFSVHHHHHHFCCFCCICLVIYSLKWNALWMDFHCFQFGRDVDFFASNNSGKREKYYIYNR